MLLTNSQKTQSIQNTYSYSKILLFILIPVSILFMTAAIFLFNRYKINNFSQDSLISQQTENITQTIYMYPNRILRYISLYTKENIPISAQVVISQGTNEKIFDNISEYQYKDGSFRLPVKFQINDTNNIIISITGNNLDKIIFTDNTLLGTLRNNKITKQNLKISMTFWNNISKEQQTFLYAMITILILMYILSIYFLNEQAFFISCVIILTYLAIYQVKFGFIPAAEELSNFGYHALHSSLSTAIMTSDVGYFPLIPRVISLLALRVFDVNLLYIVWIRIFSTVLGMLCVSYFALNSFRIIIKQDSIRIFSVFISVMILPIYHMIPLFNATYWGIYILAFTPLLPLPNIPRWLYIFMLISVPSFFLSKLLFLSIAPVYGILWLYYIYQWKFHENLQYKTLLFYTVALSGAILQMIYYLFLSPRESFPINNIRIDSILYFPINIVRNILSPLNIKIHDTNSMYMGSILVGIFLTYAWKYKNNSSLIKKIFYPALCMIVIYTILISVLFSLLRRSSIFTTETRYWIIPCVLVFFVFLIYLYKLITPKLLNILANYYIITSIVFIVLVFNMIKITHYFNGKSYEKYGTIVSRTNPYAIPIYSSKDPYWTLGYKIAYVEVPNKNLKGYEQINAIFIDNKNILEQLIIKGYDENGNIILVLNEEFPDYNYNSYFRFGTNTNQFAEIKIFNQNDIDRTEQLNMLIYTNI